MTLANSYRRLAPLYDWVASAPFANARRKSLARIPRSGHLDVLLSGVGTGLDLPYLPPVHRYVATDLVQAMLTRAQRRQQNLEIAWARADSMQLPFVPGRFDVVVLHLIVAVVANPVAALAEAARVTRTGGTLLVLDKFLARGRQSPVRRWLSPFAARIATRLDVVLEEVLAAVPQLALLQDEPALANGWFRHVVLRKCAEPAAPGAQGFFSSEPGL